MEERMSFLITEGLVLYRDNRSAVVEIQRASVCTGNCTDCAGCETQKMQVRVYTELEVSSGDRVRISSEGKPILFGFFVVFIMPLVLPLLTYGLTVKSGFGGWGALGGLLISLVLIWQLSRSSWYLKKARPKIIEVIE